MGNGQFSAKIVDSDGQLVDFEVLLTDDVADIVVLRLEFDESLTDLVVNCFEVVWKFIKLVAISIS